MADYADIDDALAQYGTDYVTVAMDPNGDGQIDTAVRDRAFKRATAVINGKLAGRVPLPLSPVPDDIVGYCVDLAIYYAAARCDVRTKDIKERRQEALDALHHMARNSRSMGQESPPTNTSVSASVDSADREFTRTELDKLF